MKYKILGCLLLVSLIATGCGEPQKDPDCLLDIKDVCVTKISSTIAKDGNYWEGSRTICDGVQNMPNATDLAKIAAFVYEGDPRFPADDMKKGLTPKELNFKFFDINKSDNFSIFSSETEQAKRYAYIRTYYKSQTEWNSISSFAGSNVVTVCIKH